MTTANAIFAVGIILMGLGLMASGYAFKRPAIAFGSAGVWIILAVFSYGFSITMWDPFYILFWISILLVIVAAMEGMVLRPKKQDTPEDIDESRKNWEQVSQRYADFRAQIELRRSGTIRGRGRLTTGRKKESDFANRGELE